MTSKWFGLTGTLSAITQRTGRNAMKINTGMHPYSRLGMMEALEGAIMTERRLDIAANNLANADTPGFRRQGITFEEYMLREQDGTRRTAKGEVTWQDMSIGTVHYTENQWDFAINGEGFFQVQTPAGMMYTRAGNFMLDRNSRLVTQDGYPVISDGAPVILEDTTGKHITLSPDGQFFVDETVAGSLQIVTFRNPENLERMGRNYFRETPASGAPETLDTVNIQQGYLELSNVNSLEDMINLIDLHRAYEIQQKSMQAVDQMNNKAANETGRLS